MQHSGAYKCKHAIVYGHMTCLMLVTLCHANAVKHIHALQALYQLLASQAVMHIAAPRYRLKDLNTILGVCST